VEGEPIGESGEVAGVDRVRPLLAEALRGQRDPPRERQRDGLGGGSDRSRDGVAGWRLAAQSASPSIGSNRA